MKVTAIIIMTLFTIAAACKWRAKEEKLILVSPPSPPPIAAMTDPICMPEKFKPVWKAFLKDGKYRMVKPEEIKGTYWPAHCSESNNVIVMVIDQTATENARYKLAYFKAKDWQKGPYKLFWVNHRADLKGCHVNNLSSDLILKCEGSTTFLRWDATQNNYAFLP